MHTFRMLVLVAALGSGACAQDTGTLAGATRALGATELKSIEYSGNGQVVPVRSGAEPGPAVAGVRRQQLHGERQLRDAGRARADDAHPGGRTGARAARASRAAPGPGGQRHLRLEHGGAAWRRAGHGARAAAAGRSGRGADDGDLDDAAWIPEGGRREQRDVAAGRGGGSDVSFTVDGKHKYVGRINAQNQVERVQTSIDNTVLGDTPVEITYSDYRDFGGVHVPGAGSCGRRAAIRCSTSPSRASPPNPAVDLAGARCGARLHAAAGERRRSRSSPTASTT